MKELVKLAWSSASVVPRHQYYLWFLHADPLSAAKDNLSLLFAVDLIFFFLASLNSDLQCKLVQFAAKRENYSQYPLNP